MLTDILIAAVVVEGGILAWSVRQLLRLARDYVRFRTWAAYQLQDLSAKTED